MKFNYSHRSFIKKWIIFSNIIKFLENLGVLLYSRSKQIFGRIPKNCSNFPKFLIRQFRCNIYIYMRTRKMKCLPFKNFIPFYIRVKCRKFFSAISLIVLKTIGWNSKGFENWQIFFKVFPILFLQFFIFLTGAPFSKQNFTNTDYVVRRHASNYNYLNFQLV